MAKIIHHTMREGDSPQESGVTTVPLREVGLSITVDRGMFRVLIPSQSGGIVEVILSAVESKRAAESLKTLL